MRPHEGNGSLEDRRLQIAVAGGSIGGLCAGLALHGSGFDVNVYERHPGPMDTHGAGIVVQGELVQLLDTYGAPPLPATSCRGRRYLDPQEGGDEQVQSRPEAFNSWEAIYQTLRAAVPKERYHMGATLVGVNDPGDAQAVSAEIEGHGHIKMDLLLCADGAQSPTRRVFACIGGVPNTDWAKDTPIVRDQVGYLVTGADLLEGGKPPKSWQLERPPFYLETSVPGSFAAADVRRAQWRSPSCIATCKKPHKEPCRRCWTLGRH
jgi:hypothetical protein